MGTSLHQCPVHQSVPFLVYTGVTVVGAYNRSPPSIIFKGEKRDKPFNWQRPTARIVKNHLFIECFPGKDHVEHHAEIIATYLREKMQQGQVLTPHTDVSFVPCSSRDTQRALERSNLTELPSGIHTVVLGLVHRLEQLTGSVSWAGGDGCFGWTVRQFINRKVAFIGFRPSFWGDIAGEIVRFLASRHGVREVLYVGKLVSVRKGVTPNTHLATGTTSLVHDQVVAWENVLKDSITRVAKTYVIEGTHITVGGLLHDTEDWLAKLPSSVDFADPEVGMMAQAAVESKIRFSYLHVISDNLAEKNEEDLSNERAQSPDQRVRPNEVIQAVLMDYFYYGSMTTHKNIST
ncbi:hypothetical protein F4776DRAFT_641289 [Hypoxylon sp. NC0597]|nr:hypothetical protein F4776DRAFT_641289 [Hypoxylon sp. NC0597]